MCIRDRDKALNLLLSSQKKSIYPPRLRAILVRITFEKFLQDESYFETLMSNLTAYETYLKRNRIIVVNKLKAHQNFIKVVRFFARKKFAHEKPENIKAWFYNFVQKEQLLLAKSWLEQKLAQL